MPITNTEDLFAEYNRRESHYSARNTRFKEMQDLKEGKGDFKNPPEQPTFIHTKAKEELEKAKMQCYKGYSVFDIHPNETEAEKKIASKIEKACKLTKEWNDRRNRANIDRILAERLTLYGMAARFGPFYDLWLYENGRFPIISVPIHPAGLYPGIGGDDVLYAYDRPIGAIKQEIEMRNAKHTGGDKRKKKPYNDSWFNYEDFKDDSKTAVWMIYYSEDKRGFAVGKSHSDVFVSITDMQTNHLGYVPFQWGYGNGAGEDSPPEERCVGVLSGMESALNALSRMLTAMEYHVRLHGYGRNVVRSDARRDYQSNVGPGEDYVADPGNMPGEGGVEAYPEVRASSDIYGFLQYVIGSLDAVSGPGALMGEMSSKESGQARMTEIRQGMLHYAPYTEALQDYINSEHYTMMCKLIANDFIVKSPIPLFGKGTLKSSDIPEFVMVKEILNAKDPSKLEAERALDMRMVERGLMPKQRFVERAELPWSDTYRAEMMSERVLESTEQVAQALAAQAVEKFGMEAAMQLIQGGLQNVGTGQSPASNTQTIRQRENERTEGPSQEEQVTMYPEQIEGAIGGR